MNLKKISGYRLKYIALFSMFLDHIGVIGKAFLSKNVYFLLRAVGRLSFPLFCFILAEGFFHTKNRKKYQLLRICGNSVLTSACIKSIIYLYTKRRRKYV